MSEEQQYRIGSVAKLTGLSSHNIRVWEKRYGAVVAHRHASGRRFYTQAQIDRLITLKACITLGAPISTIADLDDDSLQQRLKELSARIPPTAHNQIRSSANTCVSVIGSASLRDRLESLNAVEIRLHETLGDFTQLSHCDAIAEQPVDLLFMECPTLNERQCDVIGEFIKRTRSQDSVIIYRYANQKSLNTLRQQGAHTLKAPLDENSLTLLVEYHRAQTTGPDASAPVQGTPHKYPTHRFTQQQLEKVSTLPNKVECECPHHLVELLQGLKAFERYSGECIQQDDKDVALHGKIQRKTAEVRYQLELLLEEVLTAEGLSL